MHDRVRVVARVVLRTADREVGQDLVVADQGGIRDPLAVLNHGLAQAEFVEQFEGASVNDGGSGFAGWAGIVVDDAGVNAVVTEDVGGQQSAGASTNDQDIGVADVARGGA